MDGADQGARAASYDVRGEDQRRPAAAHAGARSKIEPTTNAASITASTASGNRGIRSTSSGSTSPSGRVLRSRAKNSRWAAYSTAITTSQAGAITSAKRANDRSSWCRASKVVRLLTGSSRLEEFASRTHAESAGPGRTCARVAAASTTGVSSTAVASRLSTAVTATAATKVRPRKRTPDVPGRPIRCPIARNSPRSAQAPDTTRIAARNATTGNSLRTASTDSENVVTPATRQAAAATTAIAASSQPLRCQKATTSSATRASSATPSPSEAWARAAGAG